MMSLQNSQDPDGFYEMDELEGLLRDEDFDDKDTESDGSEEVIYQHSPHYLSYERKRYLQGLPAKSLIRQIVKRWEDEGSPLPFYLFWPWSFIRNFLYSIFLMGWLAVTVAAFWPVIRMMLFPGTCVDDGVQRDWWLDGSILKVHLDPGSSLTLYSDKAELESLREYDVNCIYLSSPHWWAGILSANEPSTCAKTVDTIQKLSDACRLHEIKLMMGIYISTSKALLENQAQVDLCNNATSAADGPVDLSVSASEVEDEEFIYHFLINAGISGFYIADSDELTPGEINKVIDTITLVKNHSSTNILFGMNHNPDARFPPEFAFTGVNLNTSMFTLAETLSKSIDGHLEEVPLSSTLWDMSREDDEEESKKDVFDDNLRLLQLLLPGIPMLDSVDLETKTDAAGSNVPSPARVLLSLREQSLALQQGEFSLLKENKHLKKNVFAMLRSFQEEKRYLVIWNFNNATVSLDFHLLSIEGRWVFRSVTSSDYNTVRLRNIDNVQPLEFGVIELP
ncbi:uncharacterized protein [Apostichopus japonicus]